MAGETLEELVIKLTSDVSGLSAGFATAVAESQKTSVAINGHLARMSGGFTTLRNVVMGAAAAIGINLGLNAFKSLIQGSMESIDAMAKLSDKTGIQTERLYGMKVLAEDVGVSLEGMTKAIQRVERQLSTAVKGGYEANKVFMELGLEASKLIELRPDEAFGQISDAINKVGVQADRTRISFALFGRGGVELTNAIRAGSAGMAEATQLAKDLGYSLDRVEAEKVAKAQDSLERVGFAVAALGQNLTVNLAPYIEEVGNQITDAAKRSGGFKDEIKSLVEFTVKGVAFIANTWHGLKIVWEGLRTAFAYFTEGLWKGLAQSAEGVVAFGQVFANIGGAIWESLKSIGVTFEEMWVSITSAAVAGVNVIAGLLSQLLLSQAKAASFYSQDMADNMMEAGYAIQRSIGHSSAALQTEAQAAAKASEEAAAKASEAWSTVFEFDTDNSATVNYFKNTAEVAENQTIEAKARLDAIISQPPPGNGILLWLDEVVAKAQEAAEAVAATAPGGAGGDEPSEQEEELSSYQLMLQSKLEALDLYQNEATIKEMEWYQEQQDLLTAAHEQGLLSQAQFNNSKEELTKVHEQNTARISKTEQEKQRQWEKRTAAEKLDEVGSMFGNIATLMNSHSKSAFNLGKAAAYAQAVVSTAAGIARQFGELPIYLAIPAAAAVAAAGAVQIASIASTSFGGGGGVSGGTGISSVPSGSPPQQSEGGASGTTQGGQTINLNMPEGVIMDSNGFRRLIAGINDQLRDGVQLAGINT